MNLFRDFFRIAAADLPGRGVGRVFSLHGVLLVGASRWGVADCLAGIGFADPGFGKFSVDLFWFVVGLSGLWGGGGLMGCVRDRELGASCLPKSCWEASVTLYLWFLF